VRELDENVFAKIPAILFYEVTTDQSEDKSICIKDNSILTNIRDSKVVLILYNLYIRTNYLNESDTSISKLINVCGYYNNDKAKLEFKSILKSLCDLKFISTDCDFNKIKHNDLITFDTIKLIDIDSFVILEQKELNTITSSSTSNKEILNLLKVYLYLKCKCNKRKDGENIQKNGGKAQVAFPSYENIAEFTYTSESCIVEYINKLKEIGLIDYNNIGKKYFENDKKKQITECTNLYIIKSVVPEDFIEMEFKEAIKQQREYYESNGYTIIKDDSISNKAIYGRKGYLTKRLNNNIITDKEQKELELLNTDIEEYKMKYKNKITKKKKV